ncbi:hypothetical protein [Stenotrophomonas bentonitica]|uniref:hypothetical protein n=1 Tax=Stenotrophomonas bentonitica TaxID=1450134 RepID=UPI00345EB471
MNSFIEGRAFALLLPAYTILEAEQSTELGISLLGAGCLEICCVGPLGARLEETLDFALESFERPEVVTTSFGDGDSAIEYFLLAAGGALQSLDLVAAVGFHSCLKADLIVAAR